MSQAKEFIVLLGHSFRDLLPIIAVVAIFQFVVIRQLPEDWLPITAGLLVVVVGVALFLQGLELGIFPVGKNLSNEFALKGSLPLLMIFGFSLGFAAVVAEPALIAVADQAEIISQGRIKQFTLRMVVACSVGLVVSLGVLRILLGHGLQWYVFIGYLLVTVVTFFAPEEIVGLAYDTGGVTTNIVTVPLIAALGIGLAMSVGGRNAMVHGFGLVAPAVIMPMITVQFLGIIVYNFGEPAEVVAVVAEAVHVDGAPLVEAAAGSLLLGMLTDLLAMFRDVLPIIGVVLFFQYAVIRKPLAHLHRIAGGFVLVIIGLYAFVLGLKMGLFPVGRSMAEQLIQLDGWLFVYLFAFAIGFATTMAEPALIAIGRKAEEAAHGKLDGKVIRLLVAVGVAVGITIGVHRIIAGDSIHHYMIGGFAVVITLTFVAPKYIVGLAYDLGGVTPSAVTVPLVTALGLGLATYIEGRNVLIDGFGLIAFVSLFPIISVMVYAILVEFAKRRRGSA
ncbi:MAG TPA: DUF1538 domain-containing protein [Gammaproteobacteria bacterium]|nr:DUF1538 domain-containing protein [Gammaproteobacteria bacterium]